MNLKQHTICGSVASLVLFPVLGPATITFWMGSILIDVDHYLEYIYHNRFTDFSVKRMFNYYNTLNKWLSEPGFIAVNIFHTTEFLLALYLLSYWLGSPWLEALFYGMFFHIISDITYGYKLGHPFKRVYSLVEFKIRKGLMERKGLRPEVLFKKALDTRQ